MTRSFSSFLYSHTKAYLDAMLGAAASSCTQCRLWRWKDKRQTSVRGVYAESQEPSGGGLGQTFFGEGGGCQECVGVVIASNGGCSGRGWMDLDRCRQNSARKGPTFPDAGRVWVDVGEFQGEPGQTSPRPDGIQAETLVKQCSAEAVSSRRAASLKLAPSLPCELDALLCYRKFCACRRPRPHPWMKT